MPPILALTLWFVLLVALFHFDPAKDPASSPALWIPITWLFIVGSRLPSQWLGLGEAGQALDAYENGNPYDRTILLLLIVLAIVVLNARPFRWGGLFGQNRSLVAFLLFALLSVFWSDLPFVTFKKWFRDLGNYFVILVVLTDPRPLEAIRTLLRRLSFLLIPLSIVIIKYYPHMGRQYSEWSGEATYTGATTTKDELGALCLISGIFFFWDFLARWANRKERRTRQIILLDIAFIAMTLWLLNMADSASCRVCLALGCLLLLAAHTQTVKRHSTWLKAMIPVGVCLGLFLVFGADMKASIAGAVGRDPTFTDRTYLWTYLLNMKINPVIGTGYESFWLGPRLKELWAEFAFRPNQAHDGYIELYLNLGLIGGFLMGAFLIAKYRSICRKFESHPDHSTLGLAMWAMTPIYNITTASFGRGELMWLTFLLVALDLPETAENQAGLTSLAKHCVTEQDLRPSFAEAGSKIGPSRLKGTSRGVSPYSKRVRLSLRQTLTEPLRPGSWEQRWMHSNLLREDGDRYRVCSRLSTNSSHHTRRACSCPWPSKLHRLYCLPAQRCR